MKKILLVVILVLCYMFSVHAQKNQKVLKNDLADRKLCGKVKGIHEATYQADVKEGTPKHRYMSNITSTTYDQKGYKTEYRIFHSDSTLYLRIIYAYSPDCHLQAINTYNADSSLTGIDSMKYDDYGNILEEQSFDKAGIPKERCVSVWDHNGNKIEEYRYMSGNRLFKKSTYKYNEQGLMTEVIHYNHRDSVQFKHQMEYDEKGNLTELRVIDPMTTNIHISRYRYDDKGNPIEFITTDSEKSFNTVMKYAYAYDAAGNWIKKTESNWGGILFVIHRVITYYE